MDGYLTLPAALNYNYTNESPGRGIILARLGTTLTHPARCSHSPQKLTVACLPKSPAQKLVWFNLMNQDDLCNSPQLPMNLTSFLIWSGSAANEWCDAWDSPTPTATCPRVDPRWQCQRGGMTSSTPHRPSKPHPGLVPPHPLGLQPWRTCSPTVHLKCQTQTNDPGNGSRYMLKGWGLHPLGGPSFLLWIRGAKWRSPKWLHNSRPRNRLWLSDFLQFNSWKWVDEILLPASMTYSTPWKPQGLPRHPSSPLGCIMYCVALPEIFKHAWPIWCGSGRRAS